MSTSTGTNPGSSKVALSWLDLVLVVLVVSCGLVMWRAASHFITWAHREERPLKETFEQAFNLPLRRAELAMAQKELTRVQEKLGEEETEDTRLAAKIDAETRNPPDKTIANEKSNWSETQRQQRIELQVAAAMTQTFKLDADEQMQRVNKASAALFEAKHGADLAYLRSFREFEFQNAIRKIIWGSVGWLFLLMLAWFGCGFARKKLGQGQRPFVLLTSLLFLTVLCVYELLK